MSWRPAFDISQREGDYLSPEAFHDTSSPPQKKTEAVSTCLEAECSIILTLLVGSLVFLSPFNSRQNVFDT
jgi:hypothetical protein